VPNLGFLVRSVAGTAGISWGLTHAHAAKAQDASNGRTHYGL